MHIVSEGDTLWSISNKYNIDIQDITRMNSLNKNSILKLGQQLTIGKKTFIGISSRNEGLFYIQSSKEITYTRYQIFLM